jgi:hypothetical protein
MIHIISLKTTFIKCLGLLGLLILGVSCSSAPSLQSYFVEKSEDAHFISVTVPSSVLNIAVDSLELDQKEALATLSKLNVLLFKNNTDNTALLDKETQMVQSILSKSQYTELMKLKAADYQGSLSYLGTEDAIDEMVIYAKGSKEGFVLIRIMGKGMNPKHIKPFVAALQRSNSNPEDFKSLLSNLGL